jgi:PAS domain S-box-containing protein
MSLKTRLLVLIVLLVTVIVTSLSALHLSSLVENWSNGVLDRSELVAQQIKSLIFARVESPSASQGQNLRTFDDRKALWTRIVSEDQELQQLVESTVSNGKMTLEIAVTDELGGILVSSTAGRKGKMMRKLPAFSDWKQMQVTDRLLALARRDEDYEITLPLGVPSLQKLPIFTIQVIVSSVFLRETILPQVEALGIISAVSLAMSILLGAFSANLAIGPIASINRQLDRIAAGEARKEEKDGLSKNRELAIVQSKLNLLGQQIRGAQEDVTTMRTNIDAMMQRMEDAILVFDRQDVLTMAGPAAERLLEVARNRIIGQKLENIFPPTLALGNIIQQAIRQGKPAHDYLVNLEREGKQPVRLLLSVEPMPDRSGTLITMRDAESRRQLATQLDISRRLSAISRLTGGVAHEIKNPLNAIALRLELLRARVGKDVPGDATEEINIISQEIRRLDRVVKTFLDFTRPVDLAVEDVDLATVAKEVTALVRPQATIQKVTVEFDAEPSTILVRGDRDLLKQAILNIVVNGIEAMKSGGHLTVKAHQNGDHSIVTVQDDGPGIPEQNKSRVFQLYFTTKEKGSGIGLAMAFRAVQLHNGTIEFTSETGKGTVFHMRFPSASQAA